MSGGEALQDVPVVPVETGEEDEIDDTFRKAGFVLEIGRAMDKSVRSAGGDKETLKVLLRNNPADVVGAEIRKQVGSILLAHQVLNFKLGTYYIHVDQNRNAPHVLDVHPIKLVPGSDSADIRSIVGQGFRIESSTTFLTMEVVGPVRVDKLKALLNYCNIPAAGAYETLHFLRYCFSQQGNSPIGMRSKVVSLGRWYEEDGPGLIWGHGRFNMLHPYYTVPVGSVILAEQTGYSGQIRVLDLPTKP